MEINARSLRLTGYKLVLEKHYIRAEFWRGNVWKSVKGNVKLDTGCDAMTLIWLAQDKVHC